MTDGGFVEANERARAALATLAATLSPDDIGADAGGDWTVASVFAHLAFWDRWQEARWHAAAAAGLACPPALPDGIDDLVNEALGALVHRLPGDRAVGAWRAAAESLDGMIAGLPDASVQAALDGGLERLVDRSRHRLEHLDQVERALGGRHG